MLTSGRCDLRDVGKVPSSCRLVLVLLVPSGESGVLTGRVERSDERDLVSVLLDDTPREWQIFLDAVQGLADSEDDPEMGEAAISTVSPARVGAGGRTAGASDKQRDRRLSGVVSSRGSLGDGGLGRASRARGMPSEGRVAAAVPAGAVGASGPLRKPSIPTDNAATARARQPDPAKRQVDPTAAESARPFPSAPRQAAERAGAYRAGGGQRQGPSAPEEVGSAQQSARFPATPSQRERIERSVALSEKHEQVGSVDREFTGSFDFFPDEPMASAPSLDAGLVIEKVLGREAAAASNREDAANKAARAGGEGVVRGPGLDKPGFRPPSDDLIEISAVGAMDDLIEMSLPGERQPTQMKTGEHRNLGLGGLDRSVRDEMERPPSRPGGAATEAPDRVPSRGTPPELSEDLAQHLPVPTGLFRIDEELPLGDAAEPSLSDFQDLLPRPRSDGFGAPPLSVADAGPLRMAEPSLSGEEVAGAERPLPISARLRAAARRTDGESRAGESAASGSQPRGAAGEPSRGVFDELVAEVRVGEAAESTESDRQGAGRMAALEIAEPDQSAGESLSMSALSGLLTLDDGDGAGGLESEDGTASNTQAGLTFLSLPSEGGADPRFDTEHARRRLKALRQLRHLRRQEDAGLSAPDERLHRKLEDYAQRLVQRHAQRPDQLLVERREDDPRVKLQLKVTYADASQLYEGMLLNISEGGVFLKTTREFTRGETVQVLFRIMRERVVFSLHAEVVWSAAEARGDLPPGVGLRFVGLSEDDRRRIEWLIDGVLEDKISDGEVSNEP